MLGTEDLLVQYLGDSPAIFVIAGISILVVLNLIVSLVLAHKSKDDGINFSLLPDFIQPLLLYVAFIVAIEATLLVAKGIPALHSIFVGIEVLGIATIALKYFKQIYDKLKLLGMQTSKTLDDKIDEALFVPIEATIQEKNPVDQYNFKNDEDER